MYGLGSLKPSASAAPQALPRTSLLSPQEIWKVGEPVKGDVFELTHLPEQLESVENVHLKAVEHGDSIVFLHSVNDGPASQSYGLQVAALAGIPKNVLRRARFQLSKLEKGDNDNPQLGLFSTYEEPEPELEPDNPAMDMLEETDPDDLTPRAALELVYKLRSLLGR